MQARNEEENADGQPYVIICTVHVLYIFSSKPCKYIGCWHVCSAKCLFGFVYTLLQKLISFWFNCYMTWLFTIFLPAGVVVNGAWN